MFYDFVNDRWSEQLLSYMKVEPGRLPKLVKPAQVLGTLAPELAKELNLSAETQLIAGGGDQQCAMLGSGAIQQGDMEVCIGTAANILAALEAPRRDENHRLICHRSLVPDQFVLEGAMLSTGKLIEWLADVFYPGEDKKNFYLKLNYEVATNSHPGANGLLITPHFEGTASPHWNLMMHAAFVWGSPSQPTVPTCAGRFWKGFLLRSRKILFLCRKWAFAPSV